MKTRCSDSAKRSRIGGFVAIALLLIALVATVSQRLEDHGSKVADFRSGKARESDLPSDASFAPTDDRRGRGVLIPRAARGGIPSPEAHSSWGFLIAEDIIGAPQPGDVAYLARLGPDRGLMKVEAVEGDRAVLSIDTLDRALIRDSDRVETMPPSVPFRSKSPAEQAAPSEGEKP